MQIPPEVLEQEDVALEIVYNRVSKLLNSSIGRPIPVKDSANIDFI